MTRFMLLIIFISANCINIKCDEEQNTTEAVSELSEKTDLLSANSESSETKAENTETKRESSKSNEDGEEVRVYRSSFNGSTRNQTQVDETSKTKSTEGSIKEKSSSSEVVTEVNKEDKESVELKDKTSNIETSQDETKSAKNAEKQSEELPEISKSTSETEGRKTEDPSEASAESKLSDNEKTSSKINETDRKLESGENEKSNESGLNEGFETRRTLSHPDPIVIDTKSRADTTSNAIEPEVKTALKQNLNTYNNFNEFGTNGNSKLIESSRQAPSPIPIKTTVPIVTNPANSEIINQQYIPKFYPRPELNINFPNVNSDFQGPRDLPIYLKVKQDDIHSKNQFMEASNLQFKSEGNTQVNQRNQQQYPQSQAVFDSSRSLINKPLKNSRIDAKNQIPQLYQIQGPRDNFLENRQLANLNHDTRNRLQPLNNNQMTLNSDYKQLGDLDREPRYQEQGMLNSKMGLNIKDKGNEYPLYRQPQGMINLEMGVDNKQFGSDRFANPYYIQPPNPQQANIVNTQKKIMIDVIPKNIKNLFQKLASASQNPSKLPTKLSNNNQHHPYFTNPNYSADSPFFDFSYVAGYQHPT